jgi:hypothetical protein
MHLFRNPIDDDRQPPSMHRRLRVAFALMVTVLPLNLGFADSPAAGQTEPGEYEAEAAPSATAASPIVAPAAPQPASAPITAPQVSAVASIPAQAPARSASSFSMMGPIPEGRFIPYVSPCSFETPQFKLSQSMSIVGEQVGWYVLGLKSGSRLTLRFYTTLNEELVEQQSLEVDAWCTSMGTFPIRIPDQYFVVLSGLTPQGETITMIEGVRGVMDLRPPAAPTPAPPAPPAAPSAFRATPVNATMVRLDWTDNSRNETGFTIDVTSNWGGFTAGAVANANSITIGTLQPSTQHCFSIAAVSDAGQSPRRSTCTLTPREVEPATVAR